MRVGIVGRCGEGDGSGRLLDGVAESGGMAKGVVSAGKVAKREMGGGGGAGGPGRGWGGGES